MGQWFAALLLWLLPLAAHAQPTFYQPVGAGFRIEFPSPPAVSSRDLGTTVGTLKVTTAIYESAEMTLLATHTVFPRGAVGDPHAALDGARNNALRNGERKLIVERRLSIGGHPARRLTLEDAAGQNRMVMLLVVNGDRLYQASVTTEPQPTLPVVGERFIRSFALLAN